MSGGRRRRSGSFKKPDFQAMPGRKARSQPAFRLPKLKLPSIRLPSVRVDWMNAAIFAVLAVNVGLIGFGIRQCAAGKTKPRADAKKQAAVTAQSGSAEKGSADRSEKPPAGAASARTGGGTGTPGGEAAGKKGASGGADAKRPAAAPEKPRGPLQVEVLNGCGIPKIADKFTAYLRKKGYDVVRTDNYESFNVPATLVIDRGGGLAPARGLAETLGVPKREVISETHDMYMVDATVVLGKNFRTLAAWKAILENRIGP
ncbi:MAG: LytR C-terminal domain-containing protein [bacterium]|nr:LytR C-terminal domain-containing protein [bacterium]